jgi:hypothetical protein
MFSFSRESRSYNQRVEDDPEKQLFKEIQKDDKVECLSREIEALEQMRSKYAEELKEKVLEEDEKRAILEREWTRARKQAQEEQYYGQFFVFFVCLINHRSSSSFFFF